MQFDRSFASSACSIKYSSQLGLSKVPLTTKMTIHAIYEFVLKVYKINQKVILFGPDFLRKT
jgi:hypothetical protein